MSGDARGQSADYRAKLGTAESHVAELKACIDRQHREHADKVAALDASVRGCGQSLQPETRFRSREGIQSSFQRVAIVFHLKKWIETSGAPDTVRLHLRTLL